MCVVDSLGNSFLKNNKGGDNTKIPLTFQSTSSRLSNNLRDYFHFLVSLCENICEQNDFQLEIITSTHPQYLKHT